MKIEELRSKFFETLGTVSRCWDPRPTGEFDSGKAAGLGQELWNAMSASFRETDELLAELKQKQAEITEKLEKMTVEAERLRVRAGDLEEKAFRYDELCK